MITQQQTTMIRPNNSVINTCILVLFIITFMAGCCEIDMPSDVAYTDLNNAEVGYNQPYNLDIDTNGDSDFVFTTVLIQADDGDHLQFKIFPRSSNSVVGAADSAAVISDGAVIAPDAAFDKVHQILVAKITSNTGTSWRGAWLGVHNKYVGIRFKLKGADYHYGWVRISVNTVTEKVEVHDMAYCLTAGREIHAGSIHF